MPYGEPVDVEYYGQFTSEDFGQASEGMNYESMVMRAMLAADRAIDAYLGVPADFFQAGGIEIPLELHDGVEAGKTRTYPSYGFFGPVRSVVTVEENTSGSTWTSRTEGRDNDFIVTSRADGIRFVRNVPDYDHANVRVTYIAGYDATPEVVSDVSSRLAAAMIRKIIDAEQGNPVTVGGQSIEITASLSDRVFTPALKDMLRRFRHHTRAAIT
jgi:hypothetical protein